MSDKQFLNYEQDGHIVTLTMNDPEARNALTGNSAVPEFLAAIDRIHADHSVRAVILTGAGTAFSSGGNVKRHGPLQRDAARWNCAANTAWASRSCRWRCSTSKCP